MKKLILILSIFALCLNSVEACSVTIAVTGNYCVYHGGATNATPSGGTSPYSYSWTGPSSYTSTSQNNSGLVNSGTYNVTVTDNVGCTATGSVTISIPGSFLSTTMTTIQNEICYGQSIGIIATNPTGGFTPYSYVWSPSGGTQQTASNLSSIQYTVTITDNTGCTKTNTQTPTHPTEILLNSPAHMNQVNLTCYQSGDGIINMNPTGGTGGYTYAWSSSSATTATVSNLAAGNYTVTVTDASGCTKTATATLTQPTQILPNLSQTNNTCFGTSNGIARTAVSGGSSPYTYVWSSGGATTATVSNLASGNYTVTVTDHISCTATGTLTILPPVLTVTISLQVNDSCNGLSDGALTVAGTGGTAGYTYSWAGGLGTNAHISGLAAGNYTVTVTDSHSCTATSIITITQPTTLSASFPGGSYTSERCYNYYNAHAITNITGGTTPYTYLWDSTVLISTDSSVLIQTSDTAINLYAGTYHVTVTDAKGCTSSASVTITQPTEVTASLTSSTNVSTYGGSDGAFTVSASGGNGVYTYIYLCKNGTVSTGNTGLKAGNYNIYVLDSNNCFAAISDTITQPDPPAPDNDTYCFGKCNTYGNDIKQIPGNLGFLIAGTLQANPDSSGCSCLGGKDMLLIKLNNNYDTVWTKRLGTVRDDEAFAVNVGADGKYMISGYTVDSASAHKKLLYIKTDTSGAVIWTHIFASTAGDAVSYSATATNDSCYVLAGYTTVSSGGALYKQMLLTKIDSGGTTIWTKNFSDSGSVNNIAYSVKQTLDSGFVLAGNATGSDNLPKFYILRTALNGDSLWAVIMGDSGKSSIAKSAIENQTFDIDFVGEADTATTKNAYLGEIDGSGTYIKFSRIFVNATASSIIATDTTGIIIGGTLYPIAAVPPNSFMLFCNQFGDSLACIKDSGSFSFTGTKIILNPYSNRVMMTGTSQFATHGYCAALHDAPQSNCGYYWDRALRLHSVTKTTDVCGPENDQFLLKIFDWDNNNNTNNEMLNLLMYIVNNHFNKLIIDGLSLVPPNHLPCGDNQLDPITLHGQYNSGLLNHPTFPKTLNYFISLLKTNIPTMKVYATIGEPNERTHGAIAASEKDILNIAYFNEKCYGDLYGTTLYMPWLGKIDGYWIDYEFWDGDFCNSCHDVHYDGCNNDMTPYQENTFSYTYDLDYQRNGKWTEWGFHQFQTLIQFAETERLAVNAYYGSYPYISSCTCAVCATAPISMRRSEVVVVNDFNFSVTENISGHGIIPPFSLRNTTDPNDNNNTIIDASTGGSLSQALVFAQWLEDPYNNIGTITVDLTAVDSRGATDNPSWCLSTDHNRCLINRPINFLDEVVDFSANYENCGSPYNNHTNHFTGGTQRQLCFDYLGSFSDGSIPICPYFSTENKNLNSTNALSNFMVGDYETAPNYNYNNCGTYTYCTTTCTPIPPCPSLCNTHNIYSIPMIHSIFMDQYNASWKESFRQVDVLLHPLYTELTLTFPPYSLTSGFFGWYQFSTQTNPVARWGGSFTSTPNPITLGSMEWFPVNSYPLVLDQYHYYFVTSHVNCFSQCYPSGNQPPFMVFPNGQIYNRSNDGNPDYYSNCGPITGGGDRKKNPTPKKKLETPASILSAKIYPNPSDGNFSLAYSLPNGKGELIITDISGRILYDMNILGTLGNKQINISNFNNGIYYWHIITGNETPPNGKIVVLK